MGVKRYDRKVVAMAAEQVGAGDPLEEIISRSYNVSENCLGNLGNAAFDRVPSYNQLYSEQGRIIRAIADEGNGAVFLGRCADVILDGMPEVYSFFICADDAFRTKRAQTHYGGMSLKQLNEIEKARKSYYSFYTGKDMGGSAKLSSHHQYKPRTAGEGRRPHPQLRRILSRRVKEALRTQPLQLV